MFGNFGFGVGINRGAAGGGVSRYFTTLDGTADYFTIPTVSLASDFEIEADFSTTSTAIMLMGYSTSQDNQIYFINATTIRVKIASVSFDWTVTSYDDGKLHNIKIVRNGSTLELFLDNVTQGTNTSSATLTLDLIGKYEFGLFFNGVIANVKITDAGTLVRDYPIDEDWSVDTVLVNYANKPEIVVNGDFASGSSSWALGTGWTVPGDVAVGTSVTGQLSQNSIGASGVLYDVSYTVSDYASGSFRIRVGDTYGATNSANGTYSEQILTVSSNKFEFYGISSPTLNVDDFSLKVATDGAPVSITTAEQFTLLGADWIGAEKVTNGGFDTDTGWQKQGGWTISGGDGVCTSGVSSTNIYQNAYTVGQIFKHSYEVKNYVEGGVRVLSSTGHMDRTSNGTYTQIVSWNSASMFMNTTGVSTTLDIDNVSMKRILEAP